MPKDKFSVFLQENRGTMVGIGVRVIFDNDKNLIEVISVMPDSPAEAGGMLPGDYIYKVGSEYISELGYFASVEKIKGEKGTEVTLTVLRGSNYLEEKVMTFIRDEVNMQTVSSRKINENIGYIRILEFNKETPNEFISAMEELQHNGATQFIFDVRYNPGGDLDGIQKTLDYLLPEGPIIRIVYKDGHEEVKYSDANFVDVPMIVLINENTASAAELFAAALRDYEKATLIGVKTYGKGTMQTILGLGDGSGLRISQYMYNPPYGDNYENIGVFPHIEVKLPEELLKEKNFYKLTDDEDTQLQAAIYRFTR
jgi:carboxyl-terminal processing protease